MGEPERRAAGVDALAEVAPAARKLGLAQLARDAEAAGFAAGQVPVSEGVFARDGVMRNCWPTPSPTGSAASGR